MSQHILTGSDVATKRAASAKPLFRAISRSHHETAGRFFAKVSAPDDRGCMIWTGAVGSHAENMEECSIRRRNRTPRRGNGRANLSQTDIQVIHALYAEGQTNKSLLARRFGVTPTLIRQVLK